MKSILLSIRILKNGIAVCLMTVFLICLWGAPSFASWSQGLNENGIYDGITYNITKIEVFKLSGTSSLENPGMSGFTAGSWTTQLPNPNYVVATNTALNTSNFNWTFSFTGTSSDSLHLAYLAYTSDNKVFGSYLNFNYSGTNNWSFPTITNLNTNDPVFKRTAAAPVPVPPAILLLATGLCSLVGLRKKLMP
ncbi:MAG: hypothetical protein C0399_10615 [Syntrophus sp. (in: bacteria)]|nr:hypothetical protein [Syntrophus sp. (in: bacteria)]